MRLERPGPARRPDGRITGQVVYVDRFGNLITDIPGEWLSGDQWRCQAGSLTIPRLSQTYAGAPAPGVPLALISSGGTLEIAVRNGSAARDLGLGPGAEVSLIPVKDCIHQQIKEGAISMEKFIIEGSQTPVRRCDPARQQERRAADPGRDAPHRRGGHLHNVPRIGDVGTMLHLLTEMGVTVREEGITLYACVRATPASPACAPRALPADPRLDAAGRPDAGPLRPCAILPLPGGDRIGRRRVDTHLLALEALGAQIDVRPLRLHDVRRRACTAPTSCSTR